MQKKITLHFFNVNLLKTLLAILFLSISFQVSLAQFENYTPAKLSNKIASNTNASFQYADVPLNNRQVISNNFLAQPTTNQGNNYVTPVCNFSGSLTTGDATLNAGRLYRDGVASTCAAPKAACPGTSGSGPYFYDTYTMQNLTCSSQCVIVTSTNNGTAGTNFVTAYLGSFNPAAVCTNYLADGGASPAIGGSVTFSFTLAANATVVLVVTEPNIGESNNSYALKVSGINCSTPVCVPATASVLSQVGTTAGVCAGSTSNLKVDITGGNATMYDVTIHPSIGSDFIIQNYTSGALIPVSPTVATTYTIVKVAAADNPCCIGTGNTGTITITPSLNTIIPIAITANPATTLCAGSSTLLTVLGTSPAGPLPANYTYSWTPAAGISNINLYQTGASPMVTTNYTCIATAPNGCQTSANYTVNVNQLPLITVNPKDTSVCVGNMAGFTAAGTATNAVYQWQVSTNAGATWTNLTNAAPYVGVATGTLTISTTTASMAGNQYRLAVSGTCAPIAYSTAANLLFNPLPSINLIAASMCGGVAGINGTMIADGNPIPPVPGSATFSNTTAVPVPDNSAAGATSAITVAIPSNATVTNVTVTLNMSHTYPGDMVFNLKAANGTIANIYKFNKGNYTGSSSGPTTWGWYGAKVDGTPTSAAFSTVAAAPYIYGSTPTFKPDLLDAAITGQTILNPTGYVSNCTAWNQLYTAPNGIWTLAMADGGAGDVGTLSSWSIKVDYTTPGSGPAVTYTWAPATGLFTNPTATIPYVAGTNAAAVYAAPTAFTYYTATGTNNTTGCVNTGSVGINYTPPAPTITPASATMCLGDAAVKLKSSSSSTTTLSFASGTINLAIPDGPAIPPIPTSYPATTSSVIVSGVPATGVIGNVRVKFNITHTSVSDLIIVLKAPNGNVYNLDAMLNKTGNVGANFTNTIISSAGTTPLSSGTAPFTGTFKSDGVGATFSAFGYTFPGGPTGYIPNVTSFNGLYSVPNGTWTIAVYDVGAGDVGTIKDWSLDIDYIVGVPATPATWSPAAGLFSDAAATVPYVASTQIDSVYTKPTPSGTYNYSATVNSISPAASTVNASFALTYLVTDITFNVKNNNSYPITINSISSVCNTAGSSAVSAFYKSSAINGAPGAITTANGWNSIGAATITASSGTVQPFLTGLSLVIPAGATYGICVQALNTAGTGPNLVMGPAVSTLTTFKQNGVDITTGPGIGYTGNTVLLPGAPTLSPYGFIGSITYTPTLTPCTSPAKAVVVTVNQPIAITSQVSNATVCTNKIATFTVTATGSSPSYQWQVSTTGGTTFTNITNGGVYSGATSNALTVTQPPVSMNGYKYQCVISGAAPCVVATSNSGTLYSNGLPVLSIAASPFTKLYPGLTTSITATSNPAVAANGYNWTKNGTIISGSSAKSVLPLDVDGMGDYIVTVTDVNGCVTTSNTVSITDSVNGKVFIYPNPNKGQFQVRYYSKLNNTNLPRGINVYNERGKRVLTQSYSLGSPYARMDVDLTSLGSAIYWIEIVDVAGNRLAIGRAEVLR